MTMKVIFDNEAHTLMYDKKLEAVRHIIKQPNTAQQWKTLLSGGTDLLREYKSHKWISDNRLNSVHPEEMSDWINNVWVSSAIEAGWKKWAVIEAISNVGKISEEQFIETFKALGVEVRIFTNVEDAERWV